MIAAVLFFAVVAHTTLVGDWRVADSLVPVALLVAFPFIEWVIHVCVLHWRPRRLGRSRSTRCWPASTGRTTPTPRDVPLVFVPWQVLAWGTYPEPGEVETSPTVRALHAGETA